MPPEKTTEQAVNEKVGIGAYLSLAFAVVFFSGLCAFMAVHGRGLICMPHLPSSSSPASAPPLSGGASSTSRPSTAASADS